MSMWLLRDCWNLFSSAEQLVSWVYHTDRPMKGSMCDLPCPPLKMERGSVSSLRLIPASLPFCTVYQVFKKCCKKYCLYITDWRKDKIQNPPLHKKDVMLGVRFLSVLFITDTSSLVSWLTACLSVWIVTLLSGNGVSHWRPGDWLTLTCLLQKQETSHD